VSVLFFTADVGVLQRKPSKLTASRFYIVGTHGTATQAPRPKQAHPVGDRNHLNIGRLLFIFTILINTKRHKSGFKIVKV
jgi:hypothetical protein